MSQTLPFDEINFDEIVRLKDLLNNPDNSDIGYLLAVDLRYLYNIRNETKHFPLAPENKIISKDDFNDYMNEIKPKSYIYHIKN